MFKSPLDDITEVVERFQKQNPPNYFILSKKAFKLILKEFVGGVLRHRSYKNLFLIRNFVGVVVADFIDDDMVYEIKCDHKTIFQEEINNFVDLE